MATYIAYSGVASGGVSSDGVAFDDVAFDGVAFDDVAFDGVSSGGVASGIAYGVAYGSASVVDVKVNSFIDKKDGKTKYIATIKGITIEGKDKQKKKVFILVIDTSGSMDSKANPHSNKGETTTFTRMFLVIHAINTFLHSIGLSDLIALVPFNDRVSEVFPPTSPRNSDNSINPDLSGFIARYLISSGGTNLLDGLQHALIMALSIDTDVFDVHIIVLTDGETENPEALVPFIKEFILNNKNRFPIHTLGFGCSAPVNILYEISRLTHGTCGFIPDLTMLGTVIVNLLSNCLSTAHQNVNISIETITEKEGKHKASTKILEIGPVLYDQTRTIIIDINTVDTADNTDKTDKIVDIAISVKSPKFNILFKSIDIHQIVLTDEYLQNAIVKKEIINILLQLINKYTTSTHATLLGKLYKDIESIVPRNAFIADILKDIISDNPDEGQISKAIFHEHYSVWGQRYLYSLLCAYILEQSQNFKDKAPLHFNGSTFNTHQLRIETIFAGLPLPEQPRQQQSSRGRGYTQFCNQPQSTVIQAQAQAQAPPVVSRAPQSFYDSSGGCFTGGWFVKLADGTCKCVRDIRKGDIVISYDSPTGVATIVCVTQLLITTPIEMVSINGVDGITKHHPILHNSEWIFPKDIIQTTIMCNPGAYMYDFVIDLGSSVVITCEKYVDNVCKDYDYNVACLGHCLTTNPVISHEYLGTEKIINDLKQHPNWTTGHIKLDKYTFERESYSGRIIKLQF